MTEQLIAELEEKIASQILKQPGRRIDKDEPLISSGLIDSFSLVDVALLVEDRYGVRIADTELNASTFDTLTQLAELIEQRGAAA
jgi:acyl carrier protein